MSQVEQQSSRPQSPIPPSRNLQLARLIRACERAMSFLPEERGTIAEFVTDLRTWLGHEAIRDQDVSGRRPRAIPAPPIRIGIGQRFLRAIGLGS